MSRVNPTEKRQTHSYEIFTLKLSEFHVQALQDPATGGILKFKFSKLASSSSYLATLLKNELVD